MLQLVPEQLVQEDDEVFSDEPEDEIPNRENCFWTFKLLHSGHFIPLTFEEKKNSSKLLSHFKHLNSNTGIIS